MFLFYGQIRSSLNCTACKQKKIQYEPFSNLSLPVPHQNSVLLPILVFGLPQVYHNALSQSEKSIDKPLLVHININQTETAKFLIKRIETVANLTLSKAGLTKIVLYSYKEARKNCITKIFDPRKSLE